MLTNTYLRALPQLDELVPQFPDQLGDVLGRGDFDEHILSLETSDLAELIDYLDKVPSLYRLQLLPVEHSAGTR